MIDIVKQLGLQAYYWSQQSARHRGAQQRAAQQSEPVRIVFYHRVADELPNDWTIDTNTFSRQMQWLSERFDVVSLEEAQQRISEGKNRWPTACITFDDGYADNCRTAIPLLLEMGLPFTYFVTTENVVYGKPFPHDVEAGVPLLPNTMQQLQEIVAAGVEIGSHTRTHADLGKPLSEEELDEEIFGSKRELLCQLDTQIRYLAFPFGLPENLSKVAFRTALDAGYLGVCSAYGGYNFPGDDAFHLRRFHGDPQTIRFKNWLDIDPRKIDSGNAFNPGNYREETDKVLV